MRTVRDLLLRHAGATIAVLGGGPSLPEQAARLPEGTVCLSANQHGCRLQACDYIVALDHIEATLRPCGVPIVAPHGWADYRMTEHPQMPYSGMQAAWVAWMLGARSILLAGMDCYADPRGVYFHGEGSSPGQFRPAFVHSRGWERVQACVPLPIREMGGPLVELFGEYDPAEVLPPYTPPERFRLLAECAGTRVVILRDHARGKYHRYLKDQVLELPHAEAQALVAKRVARRYIEAAQ